MIKKEDIRPGACLKYADLHGADLSGDDLSKTNLSTEDLSYANLSKADLSEADLSYANLSKADLSEADLRLANLSRADLTGTVLRGADLRLANLYAADLSGAILTDTKGIPSMICPEKDSYVGYKKAEIREKDVIPVIITLKIPAGAKRSSATTNKCRCNKAKVLSIESVDGTKKYDKATSSFDPSFIYEVGKTVKVDNFNDDRWSECAPGIHHFMTREEAEEYWF